MCTSMCIHTDMHTDIHPHTMAVHGNLFFLRHVSIWEENFELRKRNGRSRSLSAKMLHPDSQQTEESRHPAADRYGEGGDLHHM